MSRSGYTDDFEIYDPLVIGRYRQAVNCAIKCKRGQAMLHELLAALDAMPEQRLAAESLVTADGEYCTLGVLGKARGIDMSVLDPDDAVQVAATFGIAESMAREIVYENDDSRNDYEWRDIEICGPVRPNYPDWGSHVKTMRVEFDDAPARRWKYMRKWVVRHLTQNSEHFPSASKESAP